MRRVRICALGCLSVFRSCGRHLSAPQETKKAGEIGRSSNGESWWVGVFCGDFTKRKSVGLWRVLSSCCAFLEAEDEEDCWKDSASPKATTSPSAKKMSMLSCSQVAYMWLAWIFGKASRAHLAARNAHLMNLMHWYSACHSLAAGCRFHRFHRFRTFGPQLSPFHPAATEQPKAQHFYGLESQWYISQWLRLRKEKHVIFKWFGALAHWQAWKMKTSTFGTMLATRKGRVRRNSGKPQVAA